jgi:hypothetical protein
LLKIIIAVKEAFCQGLFLLTTAINKAFIASCHLFQRFNHFQHLLKTLAFFHFKIDTWNRNKGFFTKKENLLTEAWARIDDVPHFLV